MGQRQNIDRRYIAHDRWMAELKTTTDIAKDCLHNTQRANILKYTKGLKWRAGIWVI